MILFPLISNLINTYAISNYQYSFGNVFPQICAASFLRKRGGKASWSSCAKIVFAGRDLCWEQFSYR